MVRARLAALAAVGLLAIGLLASESTRPVMAGGGEDLEPAPPVQGIPTLVGGLDNRGGRNPLLDKIIFDIEGLILGQRSIAENGTDSKYKRWALDDNSNEGLGRDNAQQILTKAGFQYANHYVLAEDGYITQLIHIINPLADPTQLLQPPVVMFHGGITDPTIWLWCCGVQHHPEPWPRTAQSGPFTSWNRSMPVVLANNGYDVWLVGTRGSNSDNQGNTETVAFEGLEFPVVDINGVPKRRALPPISKQRKLVERYWNFSIDDLVQREMPVQINKVLELTGAQSVIIFGVSFSTMYTLALFASNPRIGSRVHANVQMMPIINNRGTNRALKAFHEDICVKLSINAGTAIFERVLLTQAVRDLLLLISKNKGSRYLIYKAATAVLVGPSPQYQTFLEEAVIGHIFMPVGFKVVKQYCQQVIAGQLQRYDYGKQGNLELYGSPKPPKYDISRLTTNKNWIVLWGGNDKLATTESVKQVFRQARPPPALDIFIPDFNHLDMLAAFDNDVLLNVPVKNYLNTVALPPLPRSVQQAAAQRQASANYQELIRFIPISSPSDSHGLDFEHNNT